MIKARLLTCMALALALLAAGAAAESIEAVRAAFAEGEYVEAADLGEALGTSEGHALAAESLAIYAHYFADEEGKKPLLERAMGAAETAIELDPSSSEAHLQSAHATGRYSQLFRPMESMQQGFPKQVRESMERAIELDPNNGGAHLSLGSWHAEAIAYGGMMARALLGARKNLALEHYERALELMPDQGVAFLEYGRGLLLLKDRKRREQARDLLVRASELPPEDAFGRIVQKRAIDRLAALDAEEASR